MTSAPVQATVVRDVDPGAVRRDHVVGARLLVVSMGVVGGVLTVGGSLAPWLSLYAGLEQFRGSSGANGQVLIGLALTAVVSAIAYGIRGGVTARWVLGGAGFAIVAFGGWLGTNLLATFTALSADPLLVARLEPGLGLSLVGGAIAFATLFAPAEGRDPTISKPSLTVLHIALGAVVALAGLVHLLLAPEHLTGSLPMGIGFVGTGIAQLVAAAFLVHWRGTPAVLAVFAISLVSLLALAAAVTVGLPFLAHGNAMGPLGPVEALDDLAAVTGLAELVAVLLSLRLLRRARVAGASS